MPFNVLLLPLLGGFVFVTKWNRTRFDTKRYSGERLIFYAAIAGVFFSAGAFVVVQVVGWAIPGVRDGWHAHVPFAYAGTSAVAFLFGFVAWKPLNRVYPRDAAARNTVSAWNDYLELLLYTSITDTKMVSVTLRSGKVYIGFVTSNFDPAYDRKYIRLWPISSGYRDSERHTLTITTDYASVYDRMDDEAVASHVVDQFQLVIPISEIQSASLFDPEAYALFNPSPPAGATA